MKKAFLIVMLIFGLEIVFFALNCEAEAHQAQRAKSQKIFSLKTPNAVRGWASWYGPGFQGKKMANGKRFDMRQISVAHRSLPLGTKVKIVNLRNRKSVIAFVSDRGPYVRGRSLDLSWGAAKKLDAVHDGVIPVEVQVKI